MNRSPVKARGVCSYCEQRCYVSKPDAEGKRVALSHRRYDRQLSRTEKCPGVGEVCKEYDLFEAIEEPMKVKETTMADLIEVYEEAAEHVPMKVTHTFTDHLVCAVGSQVALKILNDAEPAGRLADTTAKMLAIVTGVRIRRDGVSYEVAWWSGGQRFEAVVTDDEVHPHCDAKPAKVRTKKVPA